MMFPISQRGWDLQLIVSTTILELEKILIRFQLYDCATCIAVKIFRASTCIGERGEMGLIHERIIWDE